MFNKLTTAIASKVTTETAARAANLAKAEVISIVNKMIFKYVIVLPIISGVVSFTVGLIIGLAV